MSDEDKKSFVRLADTKATTTDEEGNSRARMEALSKGGERDPDAEAEALVGTPTDQDE
ncbi:hypothetical protein [Natrinema thermotolerans]